MARRQQSDQVEVFLRANGLASLFAWTGAQAMYQGESSTKQRCISVYTRVYFCFLKWRAVGAGSHTSFSPPVGFWAQEDVTRPFVSQAVVTDGHFFSFFCYQLNTLALSVETDVNNPRKNLLWGTESLRLYESVQDGEVVGLNDGVLKLLLQFLMNRP